MPTKQKTPKPPKITKESINNHVADLQKSVNDLNAYSVELAERLNKTQVLQITLSNDLLSLYKELRQVSDSVTDEAARLKSQIATLQVAQLVTAPFVGVGFAAVLIWLFQ